MSFKFEAKTDMIYTPESIRVMVTNAYIALSNWLRAIEAPEQSLDLLNYVHLLGRTATRIEDGTMTVDEAMIVIYTLPNLISTISELGDTFCAGGSEFNIYANQNNYGVH